MKILTKKFAKYDEQKADEFLQQMMKQGYSGRVETAYYRNYKDNMVYYWKLDDFQVGDYVKINLELAKTWVGNTGLWKTRNYAGKPAEIIKKEKYAKDAGGNMIYTIILKFSDGKAVSAMSNYLEKVKTLKSESPIKLKDLITKHKNI